MPNPPSRPAVEVEVMKGFPEQDWQHFKSVHGIALERFSDRSLSECAANLARRDRSAHERFLDLHYLIRERERQMAATFSDWRRSTALHQLIAMHRLGLVLDEEMQGFTKETRDSISSLTDLF